MMDQTHDQDQYERMVQLFADYGTESASVELDHGWLIITFESGHEIMLYLESGNVTVYDADADEVIYE